MAVRSCGYCAKLCVLTIVISAFHPEVIFSAHTLSIMTICYAPWSTKQNKTASLQYLHFVLYCYTWDKDANFQMKTHQNISSCIL